jgi:hypothetical protein
LAARIKAVVDTHASMVTVLLHQECAEGDVGKMWMQEATRQGKAIRFIIPPADLKKEDLEAYNKKLLAVYDLIFEQERQMDQVNTTTAIKGARAK